MVMKTVNGVVQDVKVLWPAYAKPDRGDECRVVRTEEEKQRDGDPAPEPAAPVLYYDPTTR